MKNYNNEKFDFEDEIAKEGASKKKDEMRAINKELSSLKNITFRDFALVMDDYRSGDETRIKQAKEDACMNLKGFIIYMIMRNFWTYCKNYFEDLLQCGYIGVIKGLDAYDPNKAKATTFFNTYIKHEITCYITEFLNGSTVHYATTLGNINRAKRHFEDNGIEYNDTTLAEYLGVSLVSVKKTLAAQEASINVNYQDEFENETTESAPTVGGMFVSPELSLEQKDMSDSIMEALEELNDKEKQIMLLHYGFEGSPMSIKNIAATMGLSQDVVKLYHQRAISKLQFSKLRDMYDNKYKSPAWLEEAEFFPESEDEMEIVEFSLDGLLSANNEFLASNVGA